MSNFKKISAKTLSANITAVIATGRKWRDDVQKALLGCAYQIEAHKNTDPLTRLVVELSETNDDGKVVLSSLARQIGVYAANVLPVAWDKDSQTFKMEEGHMEHDYAWSAEAMAVRWDLFRKGKADDEFDAAKKWATVIKMVKSIEANTSNDDAFHKKAETFMRQFVVA